MIYKSKDDRKPAVCVLCTIAPKNIVKNRVYFWQMQGVVALCESFPNVNPALVPNKAEPRI